MTIPRRPLKRLPPEHALSHDVCFYLHDTLASYLRKAEAEKLFHVAVPSLTAEEVADMRGLHGEALASWLDTNRPAVSAEMIRRQSCIAIAGDALNFLFEALSCSEKAKLTVTFALLRKPLKDNLFLLELLLADPERFTATIRKSSANERDLARLAEGESGRVIVREAVRRLDGPEFFDAELLYDVRFDKNKSHSFEQLWNMATHLVTSHRTYSTAPDNFNFVFSDDDSRASQWSRLYEVLPFLLNYFVDVVLALLSRFSERAFKEPQGLQLQRRIAFILWASQRGGRSFGEDATHSGPAMFSELAIPCPACEEPMFDNSDAAIRFYDIGRIDCIRCGFRMVLVGGELEAQVSWRLRARMLLASARARLSR